MCLIFDIEMNGFFDQMDCIYLMCICDVDIGLYWDCIDYDYQNNDGVFVIFVIEGFCMF